MCLCVLVFLRRFFMLETWNRDVLCNYCRVIRGLPCIQWCYRRSWYLPVYAGMHSRPRECDMPSEQTWSHKSMSWHETVLTNFIVSPPRIAAYKTAPIYVHEWEGLGLRLATPAVMASPSRASGALETSEMRDWEMIKSLWVFQVCFFPLLFSTNVTTSVRLLCSSVICICSSVPFFLSLVAIPAAFGKDLLQLVPLA